MVSEGLLQQTQDSDLSSAWLAGFDSAVRTAYDSLQSELQQHLTAALQLETLQSKPHVSQMPQADAQTMAGNDKRQLNAQPAEDQTSKAIFTSDSQAAQTVQPDSTRGQNQGQDMHTRRVRPKIKAAWPEFSKRNAVAPLPLSAGESTQVEEGIAQEEVSALLTADTTGMQTQAGLDEDQAAAAALQDESVMQPATMNTCFR